MIIYFFIYEKKNLCSFKWRWGGGGFYIIVSTSIKHMQEGNPSPLHMPFLKVRLTCVKRNGPLHVLVVFKETAIY